MTPRRFADESALSNDTSAPHLRDDGLRLRALRAASFVACAPRRATAAGRDVHAQLQRRARHVYLSRRHAVPDEPPREFVRQRRPVRLPAGRQLEREPVRDLPAERGVGEQPMRDLPRRSTLERRAVRLPAQHELERLAVCFLSAGRQLERDAMRLLRRWSALERYAVCLRAEYELERLAMRVVSGRTAVDGQSMRLSAGQQLER